MNHLPFIAASYALGVLIPGGFAVAAFLRVGRAPPAPRRDRCAAAARRSHDDPQAPPPVDPGRLRHRLRLRHRADPVGVQQQPGVLRLALATWRKQPANGRRVRLGGLVEQGSVHRNTVDGKPTATFGVTDGKDQVKVSYVGILPDLFREGQGVVVRRRAAARRHVPRLRGAGQARRELHAEGRRATR